MLKAYTGRKNILPGIISRESFLRHVNISRLHAPHKFAVHPESAVQRDKPDTSFLIFITSTLVIIVIASPINAPVVIPIRVKIRVVSIRQILFH